MPGYLALTSFQVFGSLPLLRLPGCYCTKRDGPETPENACVHQRSRHGASVLATKTQQKALLSAAFQVRLILTVQVTFWIGKVDRALRQLERLGQLTPSQAQRPVSRARGPVRRRGGGPARTARAGQCSGRRSIPVEGGLKS